MDHRQIQWAEVFVEREVSKVVVNIKEECVLEILWRLGVTDPVKFVYIKSYELVLPF